MPTASNRPPHLPQRENLVALLAACSLFLATIDYIIPKPLPFMRLGLANLPILVSLNLLPTGSIFILILLKILGQGLIQGTFLSIVFLFSLAGSLSSGLVMICARRLFRKHLSLIGISILGALTSNSIQILLARVLVFGENAWLIAPPFLLLGILSAALLGFFAEGFVRQSRWLKKRAVELGAAVRQPPPDGV